MCIGHMKCMHSKLLMIVKQNYQSKINQPSELDSFFLYIMELCIQKQSEIEFTCLVMSHLSCRISQKALLNQTCGTRLSLVFVYNQKHMRGFAAPSLGPVQDSKKSMMLITSIYGHWSQQSLGNLHWSVNLELLVVQPVFF